MTDNWSRTRIVNELRQAGLTTRSLSLKAGMKEYSLYSALERPYPRGQTIIAQALGLTRHEIWPRFYDTRDRRITETVRNRAAFKAARTARGAA